MIGIDVPFIFAFLVTCRTALHYYTIVILGPRIASIHSLVSRWSRFFRFFVHSPCSHGHESFPQRSRSGILRPGGDQSSSYYLSTSLQFSVLSFVASTFA